jgi:hypothetical protein
MVVRLFQGCTSDFSAAISGKLYPFFYYRRLDEIVLGHPDLAAGDMPPANPAEIEIISPAGNRYTIAGISGEL